MAKKITNNTNTEEVEDILEQAKNINQQTHNFIDWNQKTGHMLSDKSFDDTEVLENDWSDFGHSRHDATSFNPNYKSGDLNEMRAEDQGFWEKVGLGAAKMSTTAASTFLNNTVGFLWGIVETFKTGNLSTIYDNSFTNLMQDWNDWCEKEMPHYSSKYEGWGADFWGNFIGKDILQNAGFQIGTGASLLVPGAFLKVGGNALKATKMLSNFMKTGRAINTGSAAKDLIIGTYAAIGESTDEALRNKRDFVKFQNQVADDEYARQKQQLDYEWAQLVQQKYGGNEELAKNSMDFNEYFYKGQDLTRQRNERKKFIDKEAEKVADMTFLANLALVGGENFVTFGKAFGGYNLNKRFGNIANDIIDSEGKVLKKNVWDSTAEDVIRSGKYKVKNENYGKLIKNEEGKWIRDERKYLEKDAKIQTRAKQSSTAFNFAKVAAGEGFEEMNQEVASQYSAGIAEQDMLAYEALAKDDMAYDEILQNLNSTWFSYGEFTKALGKVYSDPQQWRQFFGGMIGVGFSPHFTKGADGKLHFHINNLGAQNADINAKNQTNAYIAEQINNILNSPESQNYLQGMLRHKALDNVKADAITRDSKMDYEDADFAQFVSDITMMSNAGKLGLLTASLDNMRNMNDDALKETCMQLATQGKNGDTIGDFVDKRGNFLGNTDEEKLKIREKLNKRIDKLQKDITLYQKAMNDIDGRTGGALDHETLAAYTWEQCNVMNKYARSKDIIGSEDTQKLLGVYSDRIGRSLLNYENSLKTTEDLLKGEKARIAEQPLAEGEKPKPSELQKKYESDIKSLTEKINQAKELSQLLVDMKNLSVNNSDYKTDKDAIRTLFDKYSDFAKSMPFMAKQIGVLDENGNKRKIKDKNGKESDAGMSLEYLLFSKQFDLFISKYEDSQAAEIDAETKKVLENLRDSAINYRKAILTEESLENVYEHPEEYVQQRAIFQQKVLEHTNKEAIKEITKEIKKRLNEGSIDAKNLDEKVKEIVEGIRKSKKEKRGFFKSLLNSVENTPYEQLISTAVREVLSDKKYENIKQMRDLIAYMNAAIMGNPVASSSAKRIALETFNKVLQNAKSVDDILKAEVKLENFDITPLYVEETDKNKAAKWNAIKQNPNGLPYDRSNYQYTVESVTNAKIVQNEALQLFNNSRELAKQMIWSPKLRSLNETAAKNSAEFETQSKRSQKEKIEKNKSTIEEDINKILDTFEHSKQLNTSEQNELIKKVEKLVNDKFNTENFDDEFKDEVERLRSEYYRKAMDMVDNNLKKRIREYYKQSDDDIETRNQIDKAFGAINKAIGKIQRQLEKNDGNEVFADAFDSIATDDGSIELAHSTEGFYYYNGQVYRGNMIRCNYVNDKYNAVALEQLSDGRYNYLIIDNHGAVLANVITDDLREPEKRKAEIELTDAEVKSMTPDAFSLQRFANIGVLSEPNVESDKEQRSLQKRRQECCKALIDNGVLDKDGNVNIKSENLLPAIIQSSMIMNPELTEDKTDIETVVESTQPKKDNNRKYRVFFDTNKGEWIRAVLINKDIHFKDESGKTWVKRAKKELKNKTFDEVLRDMYGQDTEFFGITEEEWQMQYDKEYEREAQKELDKEEKEKQAIRKLFDIDSIDTRKVDIEVVDKPWKSDPTKSNKTLRIYLKGQHQKGYFELVKDQEDGYYSVHFKTATDNANTNTYNNENAEVSTKYERSILFDQLSNAIPVGAKVSTWGSLSPAGVRAIDKLGKMIGGKVVEHREVTSKVDGSKIQLSIYEKQDKNKSNVVVQSTSQPKIEQQSPVTPKQQKEIERKVEQAKRKRTIKHLDEQITELEQMSENLRERAKENPSYYETLNTVETFKQYVQLVKEIQQNENVANPKNVVLDAKTVDSIVMKLQRQMKEIFGDGVQFMNDEEIGKNVSDNAQLSANLHNNSENLTFNNIDKAIESGEWNKEALDELNNLINDIENGTKRFNRFRFPRKISETRNENSRTATKASIILRGSTETSSTNQRLTRLERRKRDQTASSRQEQIIEQWAKAEGIWFDNIEDSVKNQDLYWNKSSESIVYRSKDGKTTTKVVTLSHFYNPQLFLDRVILHNFFFPQCPMKIVGFGRDNSVNPLKADEINEGNTFRIIIEQPFVQGQKLTIDQINKVLSKIGFSQEKKPTSYKNDYYLVSDLHEGNGVHAVDENGNPLYDENGLPDLLLFDTDFRLNTPDQGKDGKYIIDESITNVTAEKIQSNQQFAKVDGTIYGYTIDGKIVINKDKFRLDTPVHEYTHLWDNALIEAANNGNEGAKALWQQGIELMKQTSEWEKVVNDPNYANIKGDENKVASEVHSRLSGMIAAGKMIEIAAKEQKKQTKKGLWARLINWFKKFKDWTLGNIFKMSADKAKEVTLEQFLNAPVADFFMSTDPRNIGKTDYSKPKQTKQDVAKNTTTQQQGNLKVGDTVEYGNMRSGTFYAITNNAIVTAIDGDNVTIKYDGKTVKTKSKYLRYLYSAKPSETLKGNTAQQKLANLNEDTLSVTEYVARHLASKDVKINDNQNDITDLDKSMSSKDGKTIDEIVLDIKERMPFNADEDEIKNTIIDIASGSNKEAIAQQALDAHFAAQDAEWQAQVDAINNGENSSGETDLLEISDLTDEEFAEIFGENTLSDEELEKLYSDENDQIYEDYLSQRAKELSESNIDDSEGYEDYLNRERFDDEEAQRKKLEGYQEPDDNAEMALIAETLAKLRGQIQDDGLDIINDNQALNVLSNVEKNKKEGITLDTFKPAISEYSINDHSISFIDAAQKEGKDYKYIYDMYISFDAFEYVKQGKLKPNQEVYIAFGHVGQYTVNEQLKRIWKPVFLVKDEKGEYQLIGTLSDSSVGDPDTAEKLSRTISNIYKNEKNRIEYRKIKATKATDTFKAGEEKGFFLIKQKNGDYLTTKVSKVLNGSLLYSGEKQRSLKDVKIDKTGKTVNQSIDNGEQRPVRIGFYDGGTKLQDNMTADKKAVSEIEGFRSKKSKQKGHVVLIINKPNGLYQLIPLHVSMFKDLMNNSYNPITKQIDEILKDAWKIYTSNESQKNKDGGLIEKGGIVSRLRNILHMSNMQVFFNLDDNLNQSIRLNVNDKKEWAKSSPQTYEEFAAFFKEQLADCFVNINSEILNNNALLNSYIQADVFKTNLESMEFRNAFFTIKPIDSDGNFLDSKKDMPESHDLKESDLSSDFKPFKVYKEGRMEYFVCKDLEGNFGVYSKKIGTKLYKKDNVNTDYRITTQMRMIEYALQKNGIKSGENNDYITTVTIEGSDNPIEVLAHPTVMETEYYNPETWEKVTDEVKTDKNKQKGETKQESVQKSEQSSEQKTNISDFANDNFTSKFVEFESGLDYTDGVSKLGQMLDSVNAQDISNYINGNHNLIDSSSINKLKMLSKAFGEDMIKSFIDFKKQYNVTQTLNDLMEAIDFDDDDIEVDNEKVKEIFEKNKNKDLEKASNEVDNSCNIFDF